MASSGSFTGGRVGTSPYLILDWNVLEQDIPNNRSKVRLTLKCYSEYYISFSSTKSGNLYGTNFSYSGGMHGSNITKTLYTKDVWVSHNSDGTKSVTFNASFNIAVTWSGSYLSSLSVSGTATLNTIPRASSLNSFTMNGNLSVNASSTISLSITRHSSSFTHDITLKLGSYTVKTWTGQGTPTSLSLTGTEVNNMISRIPNATTATVTLIVQTKSGSTNIGSSVSRNATAVIDASVVPSASGLSVSIYGTGRDHTIGKFVQGISKVTSSFSAGAGYGASITAAYIVIRRDSDDANSQTISSTNGTTAGVLSLSGTYEAIAVVTDSRGRTFAQRVTFTVYAYTNPTISGFSASRNSSDETIVNLNASGNFTPLSTGNNTLTILIERRLVGGSFSTLTSTTTTSSTFSLTPSSTGNLITSSYEFRITITDSFGRSTSSTVTISTSKVVLDICKNNGVGVGKIWEQGALDIGGDAYVSGTMQAGTLKTNKAVDNAILSANTEGSYANYYAKIASLKVTGQYGDAYFTGILTNEADGNAYSQNSQVSVRLKQQATMGQPPIVDVQVYGARDLFQVWCVVVVNSGSLTQLDVYVRILTSYRRAVLFPQGQYGSVEFFEQQALVSALPSGTQRTSSSTMYSNDIELSSDVPLHFKNGKSIDVAGTGIRFKYSDYNYLYIGSNWSLFIVDGVNPAFGIQTVESYKHTLFRNAYVGIAFLNSGLEEITFRDDANSKFVDIRANKVRYTTLQQESDRSVKENIREIKGDPLDVLKRTPVYRFNYIDHPENDVMGTIHDEAPEELKVTSLYEKSEDNAIDNTSVLWYAVEAIKKNAKNQDDYALISQGQIAELFERVENLEGGN